MTFDQLVTEVMQRTRQTSTEAQTRIGRAVNDRNRRVTSSCGLITSRRTELSAPTVVGVDALSFSPLLKVLALYITTDVNGRRVLDELAFDAWRQQTVVAPMSGPPRVYTIDLMNAAPRTVKVRLRPTPDAIYTVWADGYEPCDTLVGGAEPPFAEDFHDILMHGALADEWNQLKQQDLAKMSEGAFEQRLSELRMFIAKSAYLTITQGQNAAARGPYWPAYTVPPWWR